MDQKIIQETKAFAQHELQNAESGHDWWHSYRVWRLAQHIASKEEADPFIVELGALLHDIADAKFHDGDESVGPNKARRFLETHDVEKHTIDRVTFIIEHVSFRKGTDPSQYNNTELAIVQDADRLDAMGAIGIARCFNYGGHKGRPLYDPNQKPQEHQTKEEYKRNTSPSINHFYEKLLHLKELMNTTTAKTIAVQRHAFMERFLEEFYSEWEGEC